MKKSKKTKKQKSKKKITVKMVGNSGKNLHRKIAKIGCTAQRR